MTQALPVKGKLDGTGAPTVAEYQTAIGQLYQYLADLMGSDGTNKTALATIGALGAQVLKKSATYTIVAADRGAVILAEGTTYTINLPAIAAVGAGFPVVVWNRASGNITLDSSGTEKIKSPGAADATNGDLTLVLAPGQQALIQAQDEGGGTVYWTAPLIMDGAKLNVAQTFLKTQKASRVAATHNTAWDAASFQHVYVDVNGSGFTLANPTGLVADAHYLVEVNFITTHALSFGSNYKGVTGVALSGAAGKKDAMFFKANNGATQLELIGYRLDVAAA